MAKIQHEFPIDCKHRTFFGCKNPKQCIGCYYHPIKEIALLQRDEDDDDKKPDYLWFYDDPAFVKIALQQLSDIRNKKGLYVNTGKSFRKITTSLELKFT